MLAARAQQLRLQFCSAWVALAAVLQQAFPVDAQPVELPVVSKAEVCIANGLVLDLHSSAGAEPRCVPRGSCAKGAEEAFSSCVTPRQHTGSGLRDIAITLHIPCDSCVDNQGVNVAKAAWLAVARLLRIPIQELHAAVLLVPSELRSRYPLAHFTLQGRGEAPLVGSSSGVAGVAASPVDLFVALRVNTERLGVDDAGLQALRNQDPGPLLALAGLQPGGLIYVFEIAEQMRSLVLSANKVSPSYLFEDSDWNVPPGSASALRGQGSAMKVVAFPVDWLGNVPYEGPAPSRVSQPQQTSQVVLLVSSSDARRGLRNDGQEGESAAWLPTLIAAVTLTAVLGSVCLTAYCLQASRRSREELDRLRVLAEMKEAAEESEKPKALPEPAPGSLNYVRPVSSRGIGPASRSQRFRPGTAQGHRPRSAGLVSDPARRKDRAELRRVLSSGQVKQEEFDWEKESDDEVETTLYRPSTSPGRMRMAASTVKVHPELLLGDSGLRAAAVAAAGFTQEPHDIREVLRGTPWDEEAEKAARQGTPNIAVRREKDAPPMQGMWASAYASRLSSHSGQSSCVDEDADKVHKPNPSPEWTANSFASSSSSSSRGGAKGPAADVKAPPKGQAKYQQPASSPTQSTRSWFSWRSTPKEEQARPSTAPGEQRPTSSSWSRPATSNSSPDLWARPSTTGSWCSDTGEFVRPATLKARVRPEPEPERTPPSRLQRAATAAARVLGRAPEERPPPTPVAQAQDPAAQADLLVTEMMESLESSRGEPLHVRKLIFRDLQRQLHPDKNVECEEAAKHAFQKLMEERAGYLRA